MQSAKKRPFSHTASPHAHVIDRLALSAHNHATYTSSNIHITHTHKFRLVDSWCAAPPTSWSHQKWREYWHLARYGLIRLGFGQKRRKEILNTIMNMQCLNARWKLKPLLAWLTFIGTCRTRQLGSKQNYRGIFSGFVEISLSILAASDRIVLCLSIIWFKIAFVEKPSGAHGMIMLAQHDSFQHVGRFCRYSKESFAGAPTISTIQKIEVYSHLNKSYHVP